MTFEEFLQAHGIEYKTGDEAAAEDFDRAIWEYHLWGRIPLWLVRKETDPILAAKVTGQWYKLYEWE